MDSFHHQLGHGPHPVIVLHGWFGSSRSFATIEPMLNQQDFTYLFMDYRGYGQKQAMAGSYTIDEIAQDTLELANMLQLDTFSLVGHSMGGIAISKTALLAPERIRKLIGIAPVPACGMPFDPATQALFITAADHLESRQHIINRSTGSRLPAKWVNQKAENSFHHSTREAFRAYFDAWSQTDFSSRLQCSHLPYKVIIGEHDPTYNHELMQQTYLRWYSGEQLDILGNAWHYPMDEVPLALISSMEAFLQT